MKKPLAVLMLLLAVAAISFAQQNVSAPQKFALVIGNGNYTGMTPLKNPVNDANDMEAALKGLNFNVEKVLNGSLDQIENAIIRLKNRLSVSKNSYGFFFYAGHGVQSGGINYLIPVGASIPSENFLRDRAVSVQAMLGELNDAGNDLNVIVLDACRDNPFSWARSGSRGLTVVSNQPADSIIVYATSAGSTASDGTDRNGLFTSQLLKHLKTPGLEVSEIFRLTGADVAQTSGRTQIPAIYNQFFGRAFFGSQPAAAVSQPTPAPASAPSPAARPAPAAQPTPTPAVSTGQTYKIGNKGPAGGIIFYDKGSFSNGWRYMEASPVNLGNVQWGLDNVDVSTKTGIGEGKQNTELIIAELNKKGETGRAAQLCRAYTLNRYNDWFLPSKDELNELYKQRSHLGITSGNFWSSSQVNRNFAWLQGFVSGGQHDYAKDNSRNVRAVRAF